MSHYNCDCPRYFITVPKRFIWVIVVNILVALCSKLFLMSQFFHIMWVITNSKKTSYTKVSDIKLS